jgi:hypothetical protein
MGLLMSWLARHLAVVGFAQFPSGRLLSGATRGTAGLWPQILFGGERAWVESATRLLLCLSMVHPRSSRAINHKSDRLSAYF